jgi:vanillate O-demethylase ferredoxin subunit
MLAAFRDATAHLPARRARVEAFTKVQALQEGAEGFEVVLSRRSMRITVGAQETILNALQRCGVYVASACQEGVCGTCETRVLEGIPRHLDQILSERERAANKSMMICCSRSLSPVLVLDV